MDNVVSVSQHSFQVRYGSRCRACGGQKSRTAVFCRGCCNVILSLFLESFE